MGGAQQTVQALADDFNQSQTQYQLIPRHMGNYQTLLPKLQKAISSGHPPALAQLELTQFPTLVAQKNIQNLSKYNKQLPKSLTNELAPAAWQAGQIAGQQYLLPWNISVPAIIYNAGVLRKNKLATPKTWNQLEQTSRILAKTGKRPLVLLANSWLFETTVVSQGGQLFHNGQPTLNSKEAVAALHQWARMTKKQWAQSRGLNESTQGALDFARGHNVFIPASVTNWHSAKKIPFVSLGLAPLPCAKSRCSVLIGGGGLVVPKGNQPKAQAGAIAFWQYLMQAEQMTQWVKATSYVPLRKSSALLLNSWYRQNPQIRKAHAQINHAQPRPPLPSQYHPYLKKAIKQAIQGQKSAQAALDEAQRQASQ